MTFFVKILQLGLCDNKKMLYHDNDHNHDYCNNLSGVINSLWCIHNFKNMKFIAQSKISDKSKIE